MTASPDFDAFRRKYDDGEPQIVIRRIVSDLETPVSAYLKLASGRGNSFLLESVEGGEWLGRYSVIGLAPDAVWRVFGERAEINDRFQASPDAFLDDGRAPLASLKAFIDASAIPPPFDAPPMGAGVFGFLGYDMARRMERLGDPPPSPFNIPDAIFLRPTLVAVFDNVRQEIILVTPVRKAPRVSASDAFAGARCRLAEAVAVLAAPLRESAYANSGEADPLRIDSNTPFASYLAMVLRAKEHIAAGEIFQIVLSQRFEALFDSPPFELYRALRRTNPSPFLFHLNFDGFALVGSSPEILVRLRGGQITIRPIAGTRARGASPEEDAALERDLLADPKERAEHLMLLDLGRNDVGRAAAIGSVRVTEQFTVERYSHVMHIVSNVTGKLGEGVHPVDAVAAGFPAGTVTGAPKIRAMKIIDSLEPQARGPYGGAVGYFSANGDVDTCITLRTALLTGGRMYVQAGAGIVADSDPAAEYEECLNKAKAMFAAARAAVP